MSTDEDEVWGAYAKGVKPLHPKKEETETGKVKSKPVVHDTTLPWAGIEDAKEPPLVAAHQKADNTDPRPKTPWNKEPLDLRIERNMSLGDVVIEGKIDLHGKTEADAHRDFGDFVRRNYASGRRMLLVITGRGVDGASVLRANLPRWCEVSPFDLFVLAVRTAAQHHGGEGAYYVLLRKRT